MSTKKSRKFSKAQNSYEILEKRVHFEQNGFWKKCFRNIGGGKLILKINKFYPN